MKRFILIFAGILLLGGVGLVFYGGLNLLALYLIHASGRGPRILTADSMQVELKPAPPVPQPSASTAPLTFFIDPDDYGTEDNWLATGISREIADMSYFILHPQQAPPHFEIKARVYSEKPEVAVEIKDFNPGAEGISVSLKPVYAWDAGGYAPLAGKLLGATPRVPSAIDQASPNVLATLQDLTGYTLAKEDVRLSHNLQSNPASAPDHEAAALVLTALALRENAGPYSDERTLLNRATAHLAVAQALRGSEPPTWPGMIADAALRTLAGRELDALATIDQLKARPDCPASAKPWLAALHLLAKQDWRVEELTTTTPLLVKIAWFQVLTNNLSGMAAIRRFEKILPPVPDEATSAPPQARDEWPVPDWGRAILACPLWLSVENGGRFTDTNLRLELTELDGVLNVEGEPPTGATNLAATFSEDEKETVSAAANGQPVVQVIGAGSFKAATRRHLFNIIEPTRVWTSEALGDTTGAEVGASQTDVLFRGVPDYEFVQYQLKPGGSTEVAQLLSQWQEEKKTWPVWEVPPGFLGGPLSSPTTSTFYRDPVPFGTVYRPDQRITLIDAAEREAFTRSGGSDPNAILSDLYAEPPSDERTAAILKATQEFNAHPEKYAPEGPSALTQALLKLAPDRYTLVTDQVPVKDLPAVINRFANYNMRAFQRIENLDPALSDADREKLLRQHAALEPDAYFDLASLLRKEGFFDEAAAMDRKAVAEAYDQVRVANSVDFLVDYDFTHGQKEEAIQIAQKAANVGSAGGMNVYADLLSRLGRYDEAEKLAIEEETAYGDSASLYLFYAANRAQFPDKYAAAERSVFPNGLNSVELNSFSGSPKRGCQIGNGPRQLETDLLKLGDIIVALDGYQVESSLQYCFIRAFTRDPRMDLIVWRDDRYLEIKLSAPNRRFNANLNDY